MISQTSEYALRAMVYLALNPDSPHKSEEIAETTKVPASYLSKILKLLVDADLIKSRRGLGGGFTIHRPTKEITVLEIVSAVDPIKRIRTCPLDLKSHGKVLCRLHKRLDEAMGQVEKAFEDSILNPEHPERV